MHSATGGGENVCYYCFFFFSVFVENVDYVWVSIAAAFIIIGNRVLGCWYIWLFTESIVDVIVNIFDFYIFKEIFASHESGNKTDLMQFLQKIEKIFERCSTSIYA